MKQIQNGKMTICVDHVVFQNKNYIDVRTFYSTDDGELKPTRKGMMIPVDHVDEVAEAMLEELEAFTSKTREKPRAKVEETTTSTTTKKKPPIYFISVGASIASKIAKKQCFSDLQKLLARPQSFRPGAKVYITKSTKYRVNGTEVAIGQGASIAVWSHTRSKWVKCK